MFAFSDFIEANYLVDLPLEGASFTWFRDSGSVCMSRIDRTLASVDWVDQFGNVSQRVLPRVVFDHCPLLVVAGSVLTLFLMMAVGFCLGKLGLLSSQTLQKLQMLAQQTDTPVQITAGEPLGFLPKAFVYEAADPRQEVQFAARKILEGVRSGQKRFRDYAVICSDMDTYHPLVREVFAEAGIAGFIDYKSELDDNALARFLIAAMQVVTEQYSYDSVFAFLKSGMSDLSLDEINRLENYCLEFGIRGTKIWTNPFTRNRRRYTGTDSEEPVYVWDLQEINQLRERAVRKLARFTARVRGAGKTAEEYSEALKDLMERSGIQEHMARKSDRKSVV
mgnify:CR=1 FL=1